MITYDLSLERQNLIGADKFSIAAESNETVSFRFRFDRSWRAFSSKVAVFKCSKGKYYVLDILSGSVIVPWEVLRDTRGFELAVVAYENEAVLTSKKVRINVASSLLPEFCKQLTPTETIFDRFMTQAKNEAFQSYKNELKALKRAHESEVIDLNLQIAEEQRNAKAVREQKDAEIAQINQEADRAKRDLRSEISRLNSELVENAENAHKWELIDAAIRKKTAINHALWIGGTELFELPEMNLDSITTFGNISLSTNISKMTLSIPNITTVNSIFANLVNLKELKLLNTDGVTSASYAFCGNISLIRADIGNFENCTSANYLFSNCRALEYLKLGSLSHVTDLYRAFENCLSLREIDGVIDGKDCTSYVDCFSRCANLRTVRFVENSITKNIDFGYCVDLSKESIYSIVYALNSLFPATICFAEHAFVTNLTPAERAEVRRIITNEKGWILSMA